MPDEVKLNYPKEIFPRVCIHWYDAYDALQTGWHDFDDIRKKADLAPCLSLGWLFKEDDKKYVLIADLTGDDQAGRVTVIPKGWVKKIEYLVTSHSDVKI